MKIICLLLEDYETILSIYFKLQQKPNMLRYPSGEWQISEQIKDIEKVWDGKLFLGLIPTELKSIFDNRIPFFRSQEEYITKKGGRIW
jgi:hypothetical protein